MSDCVAVLGHLVEACMKLVSSLINIVLRTSDIDSVYIRVKGDFINRIFHATSE